jgi:Uma2 family endonuclease
MDTPAGATIPAMSTALQAVTAEELAKLPDDGHRYELVRGELRMMAPAGSEHGRVAVKLTWRLAEYVETHDLGVVFAAETGFKIGSNPDTVRAPDVAFVRRERIDQIGVPDGFWPGAPDLAVEVVSPNDTFSEVEEKVADWLAAGTRMVVVLNPRNRTASVYQGATVARLGEADALYGHDVVPGWSVALKDIFA